MATFDNCIYIYHSCGDALGANIWLLVVIVLYVELEVWWTELLLNIYTSDVFKYKTMAKWSKICAKFIFSSAKLENCIKLYKEAKMQKKYKILHLFVQFEKSYWDLIRSRTQKLYKIFAQILHFFWELILVSLQSYDIMLKFACWYIYR